MAMKFFAAQFGDRLMLRSSSRSAFTHVTVYPHGEAWHSGERHRTGKKGVAALGVVKARQVNGREWRKLCDKRDGIDTLPGRLAYALRSLRTAQDYARQVGFIYQNQILYCMGRTPLERRRALSSYIRAPRDFDSWFERMDEDGGPRAGYANPNDVEQLRRCGVAQQRAWETVRIRMETVSRLQAHIARMKEEN